MTFTFDRTAAIGQTRVLMPGEGVEATSVFEDEDIQVFLDLNGSIVLLAAAQGLERIASDQLLLLKKVKVESIEVDGRTVSDGFLALALRYRGVHETGGATQDDDIQIAELVYDELTFGEQLWNDWLRTTA